MIELFFKNRFFSYSFFVLLFFLVIFGINFSIFSGAGLKFANVSEQFRFVAAISLLSVPFWLKGYSKLKEKFAPNSAVQKIFFTVLFSLVSLFTQYSFDKSIIVFQHTAVALFLLCGIIVIELLSKKKIRKVSGLNFADSLFYFMAMPISIGYYLYSFFYGVPSETGFFRINILVNTITVFVLFFALFLHHRLIGADLI